MYCVDVFSTRKHRRKRTRHFVKNAEKTSQKSSYMSPSPSQDEDKNIFDDFIFLYLKGGHPVLVVGKNSVIRRVAISGVNSRGAMQVNDGSWHQLDVLITEEVPFIIHQTLMSHCANCHN